MIQIPLHKFDKLLSHGKTYDLYQIFSEERKQRLLLKIPHESHSLLAKTHLIYENKVIKKLYPLCPQYILNTKEIILDSKRTALIFDNPEGELLEQFLNQNSLDLKNKLFLCLLLTEALQTLHQQGVIYKNLNPRNVFYNQEKSTIRFMGFEIATFLKSEHLEFKETINIEGDLSYIAPEQTHRMNHQIDYRADYYSLGVLFYQIMTDTLPFEYENMTELTYAIMTKQPKPPHEVNAKVPLILSQIILQLLHKFPEKRYQNLAQLKKDLQKCFEQSDAIMDNSFPINPGRPLRFIPSQLVYGRENQIKSLANSFIRSSQGGTKLTFLSGDPGIGKSTLTQEIFKTITSQKGYFVKGVCDKNRRSTPYYSIVKALQCLVEHVLSESKEKQKEWKEQLSKVLGINGQLLINTIPSLEAVIGKQPPLLTVESSENKNRFRYVFQKFIQVFAAENHPLTIYLQDLQWADAQTLEILSDLVIDYNTRYFFVIGSFNESEVNPSHILTLTLDEIKQANIAFHVLHVPALEQENVLSLLKDTFYDAFPGLEEATAYCFEQSKGNPLFLEQLLMLLIDSNLKDLKKDNLKKIFASPSGNALIELINMRINQLPKSTQELLLLASCLGQTFSLHLLAELKEKPVDKVALELWPAIEKGFILPCSSAYRYVEEDPALPVCYRFKHNKIQEAAYAVLSNVKKKVIHYKAGKYLLHSCPAEKFQDSIFDITNQINLGLDLLENEGEKQQVAFLNYQASRKAKSLSGFKVAVSYLKIAYDLLNSKSWQSNYEVTYQIYRDYSACLFIDRQHEHAELIANQAIEHAKTTADKLEIIAKQVNLYFSLGKYQEALDKGLQGLNFFRMKIPKNPSKLSILKEMLINRWRFRGISLVKILQLPEIKNDEAKYALEILQTCGTASYFANKPLLNFLLVLKQINLIGYYGINERAISSFLSYAIMLHYQGDMKKSHEYCQIFLPLLEKFPNTPLKGNIFAIYALMLHGWYHPYKTLDYYYKRAIQLGLDYGDSTAILLGCSYLQFWNPSIPLPLFLQNSHANLLAIKQSHNLSGWYSAKILFQFKANFRGLTQDTFSLSDQGFDEEIALKNLFKNQFYSGIAVYYICKTMIYYHYGNSQLAWEFLQKTNQYIEQLAATLFSAEHSLYTCLILTSLHPLVQSSFKTYFDTRIEEESRKLKNWASICPDNFLAYYLFIQAEKARLESPTNISLELFDQASEQAEKQEMLCCAGLINERTSIYLAYLGQAEKSKKYKDKALNFYQKWGADAKVKYLRDL